MRKNNFFRVTFSFAAIFLLVNSGFVFALSGLNARVQQINPDFPLPEYNKIALIGDSHSEFGIAPLLSSEFNNSEIEFVSYAKGGAKITGSFGDNSLLTQLDQWDNDGRSDVLIIELGTNDLVWHLSEDPQELIVSLNGKLDSYGVLSDPNLDIYIITVPPLGSCFADTHPWAPPKIVEFNGLIKSNYLESEVIDVYPVLLPLTSKLMYSDCLHWEDEGYLLGWLPIIKEKLGL